MKSLTRGLLMAGLISGAAWALAQGTPPPPAPPPPPPGRELQPPPPGRQRDMPAPPDMRRARPSMFWAPVGNQAQFTYITVSTNREALKVTPQQVAQMDTLREKASADREQRRVAMDQARNDLQELATADTVDLPQVESRVRALEKLRADDTIADVRLNDALRRVLTAEQRTQLKGLAPRYQNMMPGAPGLPPGFPGARPPAPPMAPPPPAP